MNTRIVALEKKCLFLAILLILILFSLFPFYSDKAQISRWEIQDTSSGKNGTDRSLPDITIMDLQLDSNYLHEEGVVISFLVYNSGASNVDDFNIFIYLEIDYLTWVPIGENITVYDLNAHETRNMSVDWYEPYGAGDIFVEADCYHEVQEENEDNNIVSISFMGLDVPWFWQEENVFCAYASMSMEFEYCGLTEGLRYTNEIAGVGHSFAWVDDHYQFMDSVLICQRSEDLLWAGEVRELDSYLESKQTWNTYWTRVSDLADQGIPVITSVDPYYLPQDDYDPLRHFDIHSGHAVLIVGMTEEEVLINDPGVGLSFDGSNGIENPEERGKNVIVPITQFQDAVEQTSGTKYLIMAFEDPDLGDLPSWGEVLSLGIDHSLSRIAGEEETFDDALTNTPFDVRFGIPALECARDDMNLITFTACWNQLKLVFSTEEAVQVMKSLFVPTTYLAGLEWAGIDIFYSNYDWPTGAREAENISAACTLLEKSAYDLSDKFSEMMDRVGEEDDPSVAETYLSDLRTEFSDMVLNENTLQDNLISFREKMKSRLKMTGLELFSKGGNLIDEPVIEGEEINITVEIENTGLLPSNNIQISLTYLKNDGEEILIGEYPFPVLREGERKSCNFTWNTTGMNGECRLIASGSPFEDFVWEGEGGNSMSTGLTIRKRVDLTLNGEDLIQSPANPVAGDDITIAIELIIFSIHEIPDFTVSFSVDESIITLKNMTNIDHPMIGSSGTRNGEDQPSDSFILEFYCEDIAIGKHIFTVEVDSENVVWESNENNNVFDFEMDVEDNIPTDLSVTDLWISNGDLVEGHMLTVSANISNFGNEDLEDMVVRFIVGDILMDAVTDTFTRSSESVVHFSWESVVGSHNICIEVESDDVDLVNNKKSIVVNVSHIPIEVEIWKIKKPKDEVYGGEEVFFDILLYRRGGPEKLEVSVFFQVDENQTEYSIVLYKEEDYKMEIPWDAVAGEWEILFEIKWDGGEWWKGGLVRSDQLTVEVSNPYVTPPDDDEEDPDDIDDEKDENKNPKNDNKGDENFSFASNIALILLVMVVVIFLVMIVVILVRFSRKMKENDDERISEREMIEAVEVAPLDDDEV